jgi:hypothetical protein
VSSRLWSDEPTRLDLLSFDAVAQAVLDDALDLVTVGVSGAWGSGKTTVLRLTEDTLAPKPPETDTTVLVITTDPWRYDPGVGAKETLIGEVLTAVAAELADREAPDAPPDRTRMLLARLRKRVDWAKALQLAAKTSLTLQLPSIDDLTGLVNTESDEQDADATEPPSRGLEEFRTEFRILMESPELRAGARERESPLAGHPGEESRGRAGPWRARPPAGPDADPPRRLLAGAPARPGRRRVSG